MKSPHHKNSNAINDIKIFVNFKNNLSLHKMMDTEYNTGIDKLVELGLLKFRKGKRYFKETDLFNKILCDRETRGTWKEMAKIMLEKAGIKEPEGYLINVLAYELQRPVA